MKIVLPAAALILGGTGFLIRGESAPANASREESKVVLLAAQPAAPAAATSSETMSHAPMSRPGRPTAETPRPIKKSPSTHPLLGWLKGELNLNDEQARQISIVLDARSEAVAAYETEVQQRGWARLDEFASRIAELRDLSYRRIGALLDAEQGTSFDARRLEISDKDCISIAIPEDKVVSLD